MTQIQAERQDDKRDLHYPKASDNCQNRIRVNTIAVTNSKMPIEKMIFFIDVRSGLMVIKVITNIAIAMVKIMLKQ